MKPKNTMIASATCLLGALALATPGGASIYGAAFAAVAASVMGVASLIGFSMSALKAFRPVPVPARAQTRQRVFQKMIQAQKPLAAVVVASAALAQTRPPAPVQRTSGYMDAEFFRTVNVNEL